jgi:fumarate reductase subunit C
MKTKNLTTKVSAYLIYSYVSISAFLLMAVSKITENIESTEKALDFNPILSVVIVLNMVTLASMYYYKKNIANK